MEPSPRPSLPPTRSTLPLKILSAGATDVGRMRKHNEDAVVLRPDLQLYALADGAGGHNAGNVASALATTSVAKYFESTDVVARETAILDDLGFLSGERRLSAAIHNAHREIVEISKTSDKHNGMGTTIVAASISQASGLLHLAHVGDSRCYRLRGRYLEQLTWDHSLRNDVLELRPDLDDMTVSKLPNKVITRALGMDGPIRVSVRSYELAADDKFLLCSDGVSNMLDYEQLRELMLLERSPDELVQLILDMANEAGGEDNMAVILMECEVAPGLSMPRQRKSRRPRAPSQPPAVEPPIDLSFEDGASEDPEIVIVGGDHMADLFSEPNVHVVPREKSSPNLLDALDGFMNPNRSRAARSKSPPPIPPSIPAPASAPAAVPRPSGGLTGSEPLLACRACGELLQAGTMTCVRCGARQVRGG